MVGLVLPLLVSDDRGTSRVAKAAHDALSSSSVGEPLDTRDLAARLLSGDRRALARALTLVENQSRESRELVSQVLGQGAKAAVVGLTGPPGVGKSTLADALAKRARDQGRKVAVLAVDPSSPFTGGALLGDRARMEVGSRDPDIFIRSMATRGHVGGLARAAFEALALLEAAGRDFVLLETVGVGQDEVEVAATVGLTLVVLAPGLGDDLQANKAGLLEIADILVVNKADKEGAERLVDELRTAEVGAGQEEIAIIKTTASTGDGVDELYRAIGAADTASPDGEVRRRRLMELWLSDVVREMVRNRTGSSVWEEVVGDLVRRDTTPYEAAARILDAIAPKETS